MTLNILLKKQIRYEILKILSGYCFRERQSRNPRIYILSPWVTDAKIEIDPEFIYELDWKGYPQEYRIRSINFPYALLLLKLGFGAEINFVTHPPEDRLYKGGKGRRTRTQEIRTLLDFLDEIGCHIFLEPRFHSKLILSNDLAVVGSMNLTSRALEDFWVPVFGPQEEIGVSIDDLANLKLLESYAKEVIRSSTPYGHTYRADHQERLGPVEKATRGWLYQQIVVNYLSPFYQTIAPFHAFLKNHPDLRDILNLSMYDVAKIASSNLEAFYSRAVQQFISAPRANKKQISSFFGNWLGYWDELEIGKVLSFLKTKLVREHIPKVHLQIEEYSYKDDV